MYYTKRDLIYAPLGVVPSVRRRHEIRVFVERTPARDRVALVEFFQCAGGDWRRGQRMCRLDLSPESVPHLIRILGQSIEILAEMPRPTVQLLPSAAGGR